MRARWCATALKLADPPLTALAARRLKATMPVESRSAGREAYSHLEALGRLLCGLAPWIELPPDPSGESRQRTRLAGLAREGIAAAVDPLSPDFMNFHAGQQPLVDAAFLAQAFLRAPNELWGKLPAAVKAQVVSALTSSRRIIPPETNWKLFASEIEAFLQSVGEVPDEARLLDGPRRFQQWYLGDGIYGDGPEFHWDFYNSFVIHPMLLETLEVVSRQRPAWSEPLAGVRARLMRFAAIQERTIAPDGSYPVIGRSIAYRCGAFHALALASLRGLLPDGLPPPQARGALTAVIGRTLEAPGTWDPDGWLRIGLAGDQPALGEPYISTGSLYLCSAAFLPLGLPASHPFWSSPPAPTTWEVAWAGRDLPADHALR